MVKYKVNLKFKDTSKSSNEIITEVLEVVILENIKEVCKRYLDKIKLKIL